MRLQAVKVAAAAASLLGVIDAREVYGRHPSSIAARQADDPNASIIVASYEDCKDHCDKHGPFVPNVTKIPGS